MKEKIELLYSRKMKFNHFIISFCRFENGRELDGISGKFAGRMIFFL